MRGQLLLSLLAGSATAKVFDSLRTVPAGWTEVRKADSSDPISLRVALKQQNMEAFEKALLDMSTPDHPSYGKHMTGDQVRLMTAPKEESSSSVLGWLKDTLSQKEAEWVNFHTTAEKADQLLNTTFSWYKNDVSGHTVLRTLEYSVPDAIAEHIDLVQPTTRFGQVQQQRSTIFKSEPLDLAHTLKEVPDVVTDAALASCNSVITPACLKTLYNIKYTAKASGNLVAFASYLKEYARYKDLTSFENTYATAAKGQSFNVTTINGGLNDQNAADDSGEANLDVQYVLGVSNPIPILEYSTGGLGPLVPSKDQPTQPGSNEPYMDFLTYVLAQPDSALPQTLSTSYGEEEQAVPQDYALKICNMFMQLGARGVSVLFSSGDSGPGNSCVRTTDNAPFFNPTFPAGCPYVTAVGATTQTAPEKAVAFSSGGFSIYHARPSYQSTAVPAYLARIGSTYSKYFNASGRGIPDVAAQGQAFAVYDRGSLSSLSGTSASCPTFAGVVALLNAARKSQGKASLGFLNPWLYNNTAAFTDITTGAGTGCQSNSAFGSRGASWNATTGWDPVTGLGTPKFDKLLAAAAPGVANA
ncbi:MAG: hypothetical protein MMC23_003213 [Stictis urceolatum]|nr:hypothetical protein [Stictis urceolata]